MDFQEVFSSYFDGGGGKGERTGEICSLPALFKFRAKKKDGENIFGEERRGCLSFKSRESEIEEENKSFNITLLCLYIMHILSLMLVLLRNIWDGPIFSSFSCFPTATPTPALSRISKRGKKEKKGKIDKNGVVRRSRRREE